MPDPEGKKKKRNVDLNKMRAARLEKLGPGPTFEFGPDTYQCPPEIPFAVIEAFSRMTKAQENEDGAEITASLLDAIRGLLGRDYDRYMRNRPSTEDMTSLVENIFAEYGVTEGESAASPAS